MSVGEIKQYRKSGKVHDHRRDTMSDVYHYETLADTCCTCEQANPGASGEVKEEIFQHVMNCFQKYL